MITISSNTTVCELSFFYMNIEKSTVQRRLGEDNLDHIIPINIDGPSLDNSDTEKFASDWIETL